MITTTTRTTASPTSAPGPRGYRFDALDRGIVGRLGRTQLVVLAGCAMAGFTNVLSHRYTPIAVAVLAAGVTVTVPEPAGMPITGWMPIWVRWFVTDRRHRRWYRPLHLTTAGLHSTQPELPGWLAGLRLVAHPDGRYGVVHDTTAATMTVVVPIAGRGFTTRTADQMGLLLDGWGRVFGAFTTGNTASVVRICWTDIARPTTVDGPADWATTQPGAGHAPCDEYLAHLSTLSVIRHEQLVTVTIHVGTAHGDSGFRTAFGGIDTILATLQAALDDAGLDHAPAATVEELAWLTRTGLDPTLIPPAPAPKAGSLVQRLGLLPTGEAGPMATVTHRDRVDVDTVTHRSFWIAGWPEAEQAAGWFEPLLAHREPDLVQRLVTVVVEPIDDAKATAEINVDISRHGANAAAAALGTGRITARAQRKSDAAHAREGEVAAGYHPVAYAGLVTLSARTVDDLDHATSALTNRYARARTTLRPMSMRMDTALAASLPLGLGLSRSEPD